MKKIWLVLLFVLLFSGVASAQTETFTVEEQAEASGITEVYDSLEDTVKETLQRFGVSPEQVFTGQGLSLSGVWETGKELVASSVKNPLSALVTGCGVIVLCALVKSVNTSDAMNRVMGYFMPLSLCVAVAIPAGYTLHKTAATLDTVGQFMVVFLPIFAGIMISAGRSFTATGACSMLFGCSQFLVYLANYLLMPVMGMFLSLSICQGVGAFQGFTVTAALKKAAMWILGLATTVFVAVVAVTGLINRAGDSVGQRTARFMVGNLVPVIGGALSESLATLQGCFSLLKTGSGILGLSAVVVMVLPVLTELTLWRCGVGLLKTVASLFPMPEIAVFLQAVGDALSLLLSVVLCCLLVYVVCLTVMLMPA